MNRITYTVLGYRSGTFKPQDKDTAIPYCTLFVSTPLVAREGQTVVGCQCEAKKCVGTLEVEILSVGDKIVLYFDEYGRVMSFDYAAE